MSRLRYLEHLIRATFLLLCLGASTAWAAAPPCISSFSDVSAAASYCPAVEWLKQRSVTFGCDASGHYCPDQAVTRASMALFMNRLGNVLSPRFLHAVDLFTMAANDLKVVCITSAYAVGNYSKVATGTGSAYLAASAPSNTQDGAVGLVYSTNGGTTWNDFSDYIMGFSLIKGTIVVGTSALATTLSPGQSVKFGIQLFGADVALKPGSNSGCELNVRIDHEVPGLL